MTADTQKNHYMNYIKSPFSYVNYIVTSISCTMDLCQTLT